MIYSPIGKSHYFWPCWTSPIDLRFFRFSDFQKPFDKCPVLPSRRASACDELTPLSNWCPVSTGSVEPVTPLTMRLIERFRSSSMFFTKSPCGMVCMWVDWVLQPPPLLFPAGSYKFISKTVLEALENRWISSILFVWSYSCSIRGEISPCHPFSYCVNVFINLSDWLEASILLISSKPIFPCLKKQTMPSPSRWSKGVFTPP